MRAVGHKFNTSEFWPVHFLTLFKVPCQLARIPQPHPFVFAVGETWPVQCIHQGPRPGCIWSTLVTPHLFAAAASRGRSFLAIGVRWVERRCDRGSRLESARIWAAPNFYQGGRRQSFLHLVAD